MYYVYQLVAEGQMTNGTRFILCIFDQSIYLFKLKTTLKRPLRFDWIGQ